MPNSQNRRILIILCPRGFPVFHHGRIPPPAGPVGPGLTSGRVRAATGAFTSITGGFGQAFTDADRHRLDRMTDLAEDAGDQLAILLQQRMGFAPACLDMNLETIIGGPQAELDPAKLGGLELDMQY